MCKYGTYKKVMVRVPADLSYSNQTRWESESIDSCIADIVDALQKGGIDMRASCCGHGTGLGDIYLQDGRILLVDHKGEWKGHRSRLLLGALWVHFIYPKKVRIRIAWRNSLWRIKNLRWKPKETI